VVGRVKETVIVFGANHWAADIEATVRRVTDDTVHGVMAHQVRDEDGAGALGLVIESTERDPDAQNALSRRIGQALSAQLGITPHHITYRKRGGLPRTSSGKIVRHSA
jgi:acyl-CoA synthetase (AMP-forming)/AMP-acid ligase II